MGKNKRGKEPPQPSAIRSTKSPFVFKSWGELSLLLQLSLKTLKSQEVNKPCMLIFLHYKKWLFLYYLSYPHLKGLVQLDHSLYNGWGFFTSQ